MELKELEDAIKAAISPGFRERLLAKGQARSLIWREGVLPPGAPRFSRMLSSDLRSYAYALLSLGIRLREKNGSEDIIRAAFERSASALEAVYLKGATNDPEQGFHRFLAACAFHLGGFSARAYSLLQAGFADLNLSIMERSVSRLILRSFNELELDIVERVVGETNLSSQLISLIGAMPEVLEGQEESDNVFQDAVNLGLTANFLRGMGAFLLALETGDSQLVASAQEQLELGLSVSSELNLVTQWWCHRVAIHLLSDLWARTFHVLLSKQLRNGNSSAWQTLRSVFIAHLASRRRAEIDLWPSQTEAAQRVIDQSDNLVVSLPTSAGKTRIAELAILRTLAEDKRIVFITPLRALSAQTETSLQRTFGPLGKSISALYGSIGTSRHDEDALRESDIVVSTPEKLDFALRNDPNLLDDVGLVVLDEGHMIGNGDREVRYEVQIQRLLARADAAQRRIVCLSAIFPKGDQFEDFVNWLRRDQDGEAIVSDWRPTRIRYGEVLWTGGSATLQLRVENEEPFVPNFLRGKMPTRGRRQRPFPSSQPELTLATTWRLIEEGHTVLIYCPQRSSVESLAKLIVKLDEWEFLGPVLTHDPTALDGALALGREWLGEDHPILQCLRLGVAIHHGALPTAFRKEMERLLRKGILKITVSSPTLAQGLNLTATAVVVHSLFRGGKIISSSEFRNVVGRAGRAFIDVEGLVFHPIFEKHASRRDQWHSLIEDTAASSMESGLVELLLALLLRLYTSLGKPKADEFVEYVMNNPDVWTFPVVTGEDAAEQDKAALEWPQSISRLDTAILSLAGEHDVDASQISFLLDEVLRSSLWTRRLARKQEKTQQLLDAALKARAKVIWSSTTPAQRKGYFLAGVGMTTGQQLDARASETNLLLVEANHAVRSGDDEKAIEAITLLAERLFDVPPFVPHPLPDDWPNVLTAWLSGSPIIINGSENISDVLRFVEDGLVYRLPWAIEAVRVRAEANHEEVAGMSIAAYDLGLVIAALETGTLDPSASVLIRAGFTSRLGAIKAVSDTQATFTTFKELDRWLRTEQVEILTDGDDWPTSDSASLWRTFVQNRIPLTNTVWSVKTAVRRVGWYDDTVVPEAGASMRVKNINDRTLLFSATYHPLGTLEPSITGEWQGLLLAKIGPVRETVHLTYYGPDDIVL